MDDVRQQPVEAPAVHSMPMYVLLESPPEGTVIVCKLNTVVKFAKEPFVQSRSTNEKYQVWIKRAHTANGRSETCPSRRGSFGHGNSPLSLAEKGSRNENEEEKILHVVVDGVAEVRFLASTYCKLRSCIAE